LKLARQGDSFPPNFDEKDHTILELSHTIISLDEDLTKLKDIVAARKWQATEFEQDYVLELLEELRQQIKILEIDNQALRDSRDMYQNRNSELIRTVNGLKKKLQT
jgi:chromosome segregation ATPase